MKHRFLLILCFSILVSTSSVYSQFQQVNDTDLKRLAAMMAGKFSSEKQSKADTNFLHVSLIMEPIWPDKNDGYWFYVEQALFTAKDRPYRQRVYHLYLQDDTTVVSKVYEIANPERFAGAWNDTSKLKELTPDALVDRQGCSMYLRKTSKKWLEGSTLGKECLSSLRGATYATSEVVITPKKLTSWDRGWNEMDEQVWGSTKGAYIFDKIGK